MNRAICCLRPDRADTAGLVSLRPATVAAKPSALSPGQLAWQSRRT